MSDYFPVLLAAFACINLIVLLWTVSTAFWSINRTMNETRRIWDESERALHRLNKLLRQAESGNNKGND